MENYIVLKNIEIDGGYKIDFEEVEKRIPEMDISESDRKQLSEYVLECKKRDLTFTFRFSAFVKKTCGHWEHLQLAHEECPLYCKLEPHHHSLYLNIMP